jgi:hypothetical protein
MLTSFILYYIITGFGESAGLIFDLASIKPIKTKQALCQQDINFPKRITVNVFGILSSFLPLLPS